MLPADYTILSAQRVIEVSAAFPYACVHCQEPLGKRVIINDL